MTVQPHQQYPEGGSPHADSPEPVAEDRLRLREEALHSAQSPDIEEALEILRGAAVDNRPLTEAESGRLEQILSETGLAREALASIVRKLARLTSAGRGENAA